MRLLLLLLLLGCAQAPRSVLYECTTTVSCGDALTNTTSHVCGYDEARSFSSTWAKGCQVLQEYRVRNRECPYVLCAVNCSASSAVEESCP